MKAKHIIAFIGVFVLGCYIGAMAIRMQEYARGGEHSIQAREILKLIDDYKDSHGDYPNQDWFADLGDERLTSEGRIWIYYNPPKKTSGSSEILISAPIDYGKMYMNGFTDGVVTSCEAGRE